MVLRERLRDAVPERRRFYGDLRDRRAVDRRRHPADQRHRRIPIELRAVNAVGTGSASASQSGTPYTTPGAPAITTGASGMIPANQTLIVSFTAPASNGGSAVTGYQYSTDAGATWLNRTDGQPATATTMTISVLSADGTTPLDNGTTYSVEIRAENAAGNGPGSAVATGIPVSVPDAPIITAVTPENGALGVAFTPGSNGGAAITSYQYSLDGGSTWTTTGSLSPSFTIARPDQRHELPGHDRGREPRG